MPKMGDELTILRGADGSPQHVVMAWRDYDALRGELAEPRSPAARPAAGDSPVRAWREHRGFSQAQLAALSGISRAYLTQIETGERVGTLEVTARLASCLGCLVDDLIRPVADDFPRAIATLAAMPARVADRVAAFPDAERTTRPGTGGFSLVEHVCHLRDIDTEGYRVRIDRILAESSPLLPDIDGARLAAERDYERADLPRALGDFFAARAAIVDRLRRLSVDERRRSGRMEGAGDVTLDDVIAMMLAHDAEHVDELAELHRTVTG